MPELTLGVLFPTTSPSADTAKQCVEAVRVATELFTPKDWHVRIVEGDPADPAAAAREAERLVKAEGAQVIVGTLRSELCLTASERASALGAVYWEAIASADEVTTRRLPRVFRLDGNATAFAGSGIEFLADVLVPSWGVAPKDLAVAAAVEDTSFPESFGRAAMEHASRGGFAAKGVVTCPLASEDYTAQLDQLDAWGTTVLFSAGFHPMVARLWKALVKRRPKLRAVIGISNWAFPRDPEIARTGYERAFAIGAPYLFSADRAGLGPQREVLERWWARSSTPAAQMVAVDRDLVFSAAWVLLAHVLPRARSATPEALADAARAVDLPLGSTPVGYGARFDESGTNTRLWALLMQWQDGKRLAVYPERYAVARPDTSPIF